MKRNQILLSKRIKRQKRKVRIEPNEKRDNIQS